ncbi:MAG TPA: folate-binding protein, partial [Actinoplanes sp.]|nr:folate-binding protein [Actinoplanes sp.]
MTVVMVEDLDPSSADAGVAAHYGDPMREQRTLATAVGLVDRSNRDVLAVPGEERASWLHTLTTQHLSDLSAFTGSELLVLSPHGHVEQHAFVTEDGETAWLDTEPGAGAGLLKYLEMMRFFTRVEPRDATAELAVLSLVGPGAADLFPDLEEPRVGAVPGPKFAAGSVPPQATSRYSVRAYEGGLARRVPLGVDLLVPRSAKTAVIEKLGLPMAGLWAYEAIRVEHRVPRLGWETDHRTIPAEASFLQHAV